MIAYKCDRCSEFYESYLTTGPYYTFNNTKCICWDEDLKKFGKEITGVDLCPKCRKDLKRWFNELKPDNLPEPVKDESLGKILDKNINDIPISTRSRMCLLRKNLHTIYDIVTYKDSFIKIRNLGKSSLNEIVNAINEFDIPYKFDDKLKHFVETEDVLSLLKKEV